MSDTEEIIYFFPLVSPKIGLGHLIRCVDIANFFDKNKKAIIILREHKNFISISNLDHIDVILINNISEISQVIGKGAVIFLDILSDSVWKNSIEVLKICKNSGAITIAIDSMPPTDLSNLGLNAKFWPQILITPYTNIRKLIYKNFSRVWFRGPQFIWPSQKYVATIANKLDKHHVPRILVSCGGADQEEFSFFITDQLIHLGPKYVHITVAVGPHFNVKHISRLKKLSQQHKNVTILENSSNLKCVLKNSDYLVGKFGTLRYLAIRLGVWGIYLNSAKQYEEYANSLVNDGVCDVFASYDLDALEKFKVKLIEIVNENPLLLEEKRTRLIKKFASGSFEDVLEEIKRLQHEND